MKILLAAINAKYIHSNPAVYSLRSYAGRFRESIDIAEFTINHTADEILKGIYRRKADVIGFSCYIWNIDMIKRIIKEVRKVQPEVRIWFGGPEVSYASGELLRENKELDGIIIGEGEQTFLELVEYYLGIRSKLGSIRGLAFRSSAALMKEELLASDHITVTGEREPLCLDSIPFPYDDIGDFTNRIIYYESSRGCPFSCSYCLSSIDKRVRFRSAELVKKELKIFMDNRVPQVKFVDRTFNCDRKHAMEIWQFIKQQDNKITNFHFELSADILSEDEIKLLSTLRPGQVQFEIGIQSTNMDTIAAIHRRMDLNKLTENVAKIREAHNIHQHLDLIAGLPLEDFQSFRRSFNQVYEMKPDQLQLGFLKVLKGSMMEQDIAKYGIVYRDAPPYEVLYTNRLSFADVLRLKGICEMVEVYYNSGQFDYSMQFLSHSFKTPFDLYLSLSEYYEGKQLNQVAHTRIRRYEILREFYNETLRSREDRTLDSTAFDEILLFDLCLRENIKSRPLFAPKPPDYRQMREISDRLNLNRKDTHIEHFTFDIIEAAAKGKITRKEQIIAFNYSRRDPLSKDAEFNRYEC